MRALLFLTVFTVSIVTATGTSAAEADSAGGLRVKALTFNIRYGSADDGDNAWPLRRQLVFDVIRSEQPDFCGLQEALRFQIDAIHEAVPGYAEHGRGRDDGETAGEYSAILYRHDRWELDRGETLWLSDTPHVPGSRSWGNSIPRIVTWGRFIEKASGRALYVLNTHFDHRSQPSRVRSAQFLAELIDRQASDGPVIVTGDLNAGETNPAVERLKRNAADNNSARLVDTFRILHPEADQVGTFHGFRGRIEGEKIDYVFANPDVVVASAAILHTHQGERYPSDHFPVSAELVFPSP